MSTTNIIQELGSDELDRHFAAFVTRFGGDPVLLGSATTALSRSVREGHICIGLAELSASYPTSSDKGETRRLDVREWRDELQRSAAVGPPEAHTPLVIDHSDQLYLRRYWNYQTRLADAIRARCHRNPPAVPSTAVTQEDAVRIASQNNLTVICGGPGTGKTSTVVQILARLFGESGGEYLRVALTAPTGKAASRLEEAIREGATRLKEGEVKQGLMQQGAKTIHRLLERRGQSTAFRYNAENPLPLDVLVVDEASMVALPLLAKLFDALPVQCRVLLLGDRDQLASVEPGAALADMIDAAVSGSPVAGSVVTLQKNYRFGDDSGIQKNCIAVRQGDVEATVTGLRARDSDDLISTEVSTLADMQNHVACRATQSFAKAVTEKDPAAALKALKQYRVLTPLREGAWGVVGLTRTIEDALFAAGLIAEQGASPYAGKPILILQNDYDLELYNGDLGVLLPDPDAPAEPRQLYGWFPSKDDSVRRFAHARLPAHETAYAMTVHKSQGSEFDHVLFVLPVSDSPLLTRELIYTALTRARAIVELIWNEPVLSAAIARRRERASGLCDLLRKSS